MAGQLEFSLQSPRRDPLNVTQLVRTVREALEFHLDEYWVVGEISNARLAPSNHFYFTLKDPRSAINVVMFNTAFRRLRFRPADGMQVVVRGRVSLYEARGTLQFYAEELEPRGLGGLQAAFEQLKQRLDREGLFDSAHKRPLPFLPRTVGIVTALNGAGLQDILRILYDRCTNLQIVVRPARVQGSGAAREIAAAIADLNADGRAEVIIVGRGGGSLEDLWAFNEEVVARAIYRSAIPIVAAVGHEIDYTIADFVADVRAPTPTAAAQLVVPDQAELRRRVAETEATLVGATRSAVNAERRATAQLASRLREPRNLLRQARQRVDETAAELGATLQARTTDARRNLRVAALRLRTPAGLIREARLVTGRTALRLGQLLETRLRPLRIALARTAAHLSETNLRGVVTARQARVASLEERLSAVARATLTRHRTQLGLAAQRLDAISPLRVLERGYAVVTDANRRVVVAATEVQAGDELEVRLHRGRLRVRTTAREI